MKIFLLIFCFFSLNLRAKEKQQVIFWLSIDGMKFNYIEKADAPAFKELVSKSVYTKSLKPIYPSITFPSHSGLATGVGVKDHGISLNTFFDSKSQEFHPYPGPVSFLQAEPIWETVKKSNLRSAVIDWPLSYEQKGQFAADYFENKFNKDLSDEERIDHALKVWEKDLSYGKQFHLIMAYVSGVDTAGHEYGPRSEQVLRVVENLDKQILKIMEKIKALSKNYPEFEYSFLITSDHGMTEAKYGVQFEKMSQLPETSNVYLVPGGPIGHVFLNHLKTPEKNRWLRYLLKQYSAYEFVTVYEKSKLPKTWNYDHATRVGDLVLVMDEGYTFIKAAEDIVTPIKKLGGPMGIHGFDPKSHASMDAVMIYWKYPEHPNRQELAKSISALQIYPSIAKILGAKPHQKAKGKVITELLTP